MKSFICVSVLLVGRISWAGLSVCEIFSDHMVLQRDRDVPVWGRASSGDRVEVAFAGRVVKTVADGKGDWQVTLPAMKWNARPGRLVVRGADRTIRFEDVLVGDVWLVSGQSNAEMNFADGVIGGDEAKARAKNHPCVRAVKFRHERALIPDRHVSCGPWVVADAGSLDGISAEGYYMARELNARTGIPMGILDNNWGGCRIEPYLSVEAMAKVPSLSAMHAKAVEQKTRLESGYWRKKVFAAQDEFIAWSRRIADRRTAGDEPLNVPCIWHPFNSDLCGQYNAMIAPVTRFPIAGATWYQGCSNHSDGEGYAEKLCALVDCWRAAWGYEFPFYIVQLASFMPKTADPAGGDGYAKIRNAQFRCARKIARSGLAVAIDIGNAENIHPKNKYDIGYRLSLWARRDVYGERNLVVSGPLYRDFKVEGAQLRIRFDHVGGGLLAGERGPDEPGAKPRATPDGRLRGFAIAGADRKWSWADAVIDGPDVLVSSRQVKAPVAVRYAFRGNPMGDCNLYNAEGLPASPFRSDDW